jgi:beta-phosphoglucomutase-like phosphatase (HAD superfamily)
MENGAVTLLTNEVELRRFLAVRGPFKVAVWDFDGVVGDTEPSQAEAYRSMLIERGIDPAPDFFSELAGRSEREIWAALQKSHRFDGEFSALRAERIARVIPVLASHVEPNWFVRAGVAALREAGTRSTIVSSGNREVIDAYLDAWDLRELFHEISAASGSEDDVPKRQRLRGAIAGVPALVIEDSAAYLRFAADLGAATLGVAHGLNDGALPVADAVMVSRAEAVG